VSGTEIRFVTGALTGSAIPPCNGQVSRALTVTNIEGGASASGGSFTFTGPPNPLIFGVSPNVGARGINVTISGQNFDPSALRVLFGGADGASAPIVSANTQSIVATVPTPPPTFQFTTRACDGNGDNIPSGTQELPTPISITVRNLITGCEATLSNAFTMNPENFNPVTGAGPCTGDTSTPPTSTVACNDGLDNDGDGFIDFGGDAGCTSATGTTERTQCQDGIDNDGDTVFDANPPNAVNPDPGCSTLQDTVEN
jgi:hypothetical protein